MKILNTLFNYKKATSDNKILGVERCFIDYSKHLIAHGHQVVSVTNPKMVYADAVKATGSGLLELPGWNRVDLYSILRLAFFCLFFRPDAVLCHSGKAMYFVRGARFFCFKKFPIIAVDHGINPKKFLAADAVFTVNSFFSRELIKAGKSEDSAIVMPNMIDIPANFSLPQKPEFRRPLKIGSLGRLYFEKNFDKMVRALPILSARGIECEYVIGGVGPEEEKLNNLARELGVEKNFKILGWTSDKKTFFDGIDIFVLPSMGETFGIVLLEAMLYNTPIVTSNSWGSDEVIEEGVTGLKASKDDGEKMPELLADAIERLVKDQDFARKLAANAHQKFLDNYCSEKVGKKLSDTVVEIVRKFR